ncbi:Receptor-type tyrosine-protein phosphatase T [Holothuria leucospilota]|uniref:protein-tyrosine-phosphatase n=1 Tax=Holothuria leucospilota TaxID=206669 RepID=A0A9Q1C9K5_HOLLE|nr:Receptor-type tyrosine-protein phosphatase T [Holothuria leucospilota]
MKFSVVLTILCSFVAASYRANGKPLENVRRKALQARVRFSWNNVQLTAFKGSWRQEYQREDENKKEHILHRNTRNLEREREINFDESKGQSLYESLLVFIGSMCVLVLSLAICSGCCGRKKKRKVSKVKLNEGKDKSSEDKDGTFITSVSYNANNGGVEGSQSEETKKLLQRNPRGYHTYENLPNTVQVEVLSSEPSEEESGRSPIRKGLLANEVQKLASTDNGYKNEFEELRVPETPNQEFSQLEANKPKNRFKNILPYDHTLVNLTDGEGSDYINASYIKGYNDREMAYIATQGPLESTVVDFWRMIWQEESKEIIMLTNLVENKKKKCWQYWPNQGKSNVYGKITVRNVSEVKETFQYTVRCLEVSKEGEEENRIVRQYHFGAWSDMSDIASATPIWELLKQLRSERKQQPEDDDVEDSAPIVVHCSAGCGRTGTVITMDVMRQMMKYDGQVDVFNFVKKLRTQRMNMVQVVTQYRFIYESLLIYMRLKRTCFPPSKFLEKLGDWETKLGDSTISGLNKQFQLFEYLHPEKISKHGKSGLSTENQAKNRSLDIIPDDINRPLLQTQVFDDETSTNYINASFFNGNSKRSVFLATQAPMVNTYTDFWRMVFDYDSSIIVGFHGSDRDTFPNYWPSDSAELGPFAIDNNGEEVVSDNLTIRAFKLCKLSKDGAKSPKNTREIKQYCINNIENIHGDQLAILLVELINQHIRPRHQLNQENRITVHCEYGIGLSGVFIALYNAIDMLKDDNKVDVFTIVKLLRINRFNMVDSLERYQLIYNAVKYYINNPPEAEPTEEEQEEPTYANL